jgi:hypothetical protein
MNFCIDSPSRLGGSGAVLTELSDALAPPRGSLSNNRFDSLSDLSSESVAVSRGKQELELMAPMLFWSRLRLGN